MSFFEISESTMLATSDVDEAYESILNARPTLVLPFVKRLCARLQEENINYCHWKSNAALARSASGDNDLDLLVSRADAQRFTTILYQMGCKQAHPPGFMQIPGILDFYAYDQQAERMVHVHVHYQLVLGHDRTKNYRLPIEEAFLASCRQGALFRVPSLEFELLVFTFRMVLKYCTWDAALLIRRSELPATEKAELVYFAAGLVDQQKLYGILEEHMPWISPRLFDDCLQAVRSDCSFLQKIKAGHELLKQLRGYGRRGHVIDVSLKFLRQVHRSGHRRIYGGPPKKTWDSGGLMIAIVGGDGAGKTTLIEGLSKWLGKDFRSRQVHLGKPPKSWLTHTVRALLKMGRSITPNKPWPHPLPKDVAVDFIGLSSLFWYVCAARDRVKLYRQTERWVTNGAIAICDRHPLEQLQLMDAPQIERLVAPEYRTWLIKWLARLEKRWSQEIVAPRMLIVLKLDPNVAVQRKFDEPEAHVRPRSTEVWQTDWNQQTENSITCIVDAAHSSDQVLAQVKSFIWNNI